MVRCRRQQEFCGLAHRGFTGAQGDRTYKVKIKSHTTRADPEAKAGQSVVCNGADAYRPTSHARC